MESKQEFKVGDAVSWTQISQRGRVVSMRLRNGTILEIGRTQAAVQPSGKGKPVVVTLARLRRPNEPSRIDEVIEAMRKGGAQ